MLAAALAAISGAATAADLRSALDEAARSLDSGAALAKLDGLVAYSGRFS